MKSTINRFGVRNVCAVGVAVVFTVAMLVPLGCRTASSVGLPLSPGPSYMLSEASDLRAAAAPPQGEPTELAKATLSPHRMEAGDVMVIEPNDFNSPIRLQSDQTVQQDGTIDLGSYGRMYVAGLTAEQIQGRVQSTVTQYEARKQSQRVTRAGYQGDTPAIDDTVDLGVSVRLVNQESGNIYVMGEVNAPGSYPITGSETVLDAIITAGGLTLQANDLKIILTRPQLPGQPRVILPVDYQSILQLGDVSTNYQLQPGDRLYIPSFTLWEDIRQSMPWTSNKSW